MKPLLKKDNLDKEIFKNYRPVSNLPYLSKIIEHFVSVRIISHLTGNSLWDKMQSAYRAMHSTESALLRVHNDILSSIDSGKMVALALLDLSAAFDTIDHKILRQRLKDKFSMGGIALKWIT